MVGVREAGGGRGGCSCAVCLRRAERGCSGSTLPDSLLSLPALSLVSASLTCGGETGLSVFFAWFSLFLSVYEVTAREEVCGREGIGSASSGATKGEEGTLFG